MARAVNVLFVRLIDPMRDLLQTARRTNKALPEVYIAPLSQGEAALSERIELAMGPAVYGLERVQTAGRRERRHELTFTVVVQRGGGTGAEALKRLTGVVEDLVAVLTAERDHTLQDGSQAWMGGEIVSGSLPEVEAGQMDLRCSLTWSGIVWGEH